MEYIFKYIIIGDSGVGKSSILNTYMTNEFDPHTNSTIGVEFYTKRLNIDDKKIKIHMWDLAGQERFNSIVKTYYRNCNGVLLIFDLTNKNSFDHVNYWYNELYKMYSLDNIDEYNPSIFLIGNKNDISDRTVSTKDVEKMLFNKNITNYMECSAKTGDNINDIFNMLNNSVYQNIEKYNYLEKLSKINNIIKINNHKSSTPKDNSYCCYL
jgi:small GTP-binding protein